jgi:hypothetical protein
MTLRLITYLYLLGQAVYGFFVAFDSLLDNQFVFGAFTIPRQLIGGILMLSSILAIGFRVPERYQARHLLPLMFAYLYRIIYIWSLPDRGKAATISYATQIAVIVVLLAYAPYDHATNTDHHV